jgi:hypothetical protein
VQDEGFVAIEIIAQYHQRHPWVFLMHRGDEALGRIEFTSLLDSPIKSPHLFHMQGQHAVRACFDQCRRD